MPCHAHMTLTITVIISRHPSHGARSRGPRSCHDGCDNQPRSKIHSCLRRCSSGSPRSKKSCWALVQNQGAISSPDPVRLIGELTSHLTCAWESCVGSLHTANQVCRSPHTTRKCRPRDKGAPSGAKILARSCSVIQATTTWSPARQAGHMGRQYRRYRNNTIQQSGPLASSLPSRRVSMPVSSAERIEQRTQIHR